MRRGAACAALWLAACGARTVPEFRGAPSDAALDAARDAGVDASLVDVGVDAETPRCEVAIAFLPVERAQLAVWIEGDEEMRTLALTEAVGLRGIGNRPGAMQMNSGFRYPIGRREGVLPVWAHRRLALGGRPFRRVIHQNRVSEGFASETSRDSSRDHFFCLSFDQSTTMRDALDAVSCASQLHSDKGRFITDADLVAGYAEPFEREDGGGEMRLLSAESLYPPRRDLVGQGMDDHLDSTTYVAHAAEVMPELDAITMATPSGLEVVTVTGAVPERWRTVRVRLEIHTEGDYNETYNPELYPTPTEPLERWDVWARIYGYPYRGQPSVIFEVELDAGVDVASTRDPAGRGEPHGFHGDVMTDMRFMTDDAAAAPGRGIDRLMAMEDGARLRAQLRCR